MVNKVFKIEVKLASGSKAALYLGAGNFVVEETKGEVVVNDGVHNNGGWKLAKEETYDKVIGKIDEALRLTI